MEVNFLLALLILLAAAVALAPLAKWAGLSTIIGYLAAGILIGPYGLGVLADSETIHQVADWGIVLMLFLIGLELHPAELWRMRSKLLGFGLPQLVLTAAILMVLLALSAVPWQAALIAGLALAMSSTAIAMQSVAQRSITRTDTGRASLAILLVQDIAVIPVLALIPVLAVTTGSPVDALAEGAVEVAEEVTGPRGWVVAATIVGAFAAAMLGSRYVIRPLMHFVALTNVREAFTALALLLVIGAAVALTSVGLSPALGAFLGGVLLADSEYRHELQSNIEPFKGLLLGLFFMSVGASIAFSALLDDPLTVLALVGALVGIKLLVIFGLATLFRMHVAERLLLGILLSQAGEFAFVVLQFARLEGVFGAAEAEVLTVVVALSMATTPLFILLYDKLWAPRLHARDGMGGDDAAPIEGRNKVIMLGYGRFGQIVTRMLRAQGFEMTLIDDDPAQIELVKRFGVKVFYGDGGRLDILRAAGAADAQMIIIAVAGGERILAIAELIRRHFPHVTIAARAVDRNHAHDLMALGVTIFERETFRSAIHLGEQALVALGHDAGSAHRLAVAFESHDMKMLRDSYAVRHDRDAYIGFVRRSTEMLDEVMRADRLSGETAGDEAGPAAADIDKPAKASSD